MIAIGALFVLPSAYLAWHGRDMPEFGQVHDDSIYYVTAKALAQGRGYRIESMPGEPWQTKYPPLEPLFLALVWRMEPRFPANLELATLFSWVWFPVWMALAHRMFRDLGLGGRAALALCGVLGLNGTAAAYAKRAEPEVMVAALWTASAALAVGRPKIGESPAGPWRAAGAGLLAGAAYLAKTAALPLAAAVPLYYAVRRQFRNAGLFLAGMLPAIAGWSLWMRAHRDLPAGSLRSHTTDFLRMYYTDYLGYHWHTVRMAGYGNILAKNADTLLAALGAVVVNWRETPGLAERFLGALILVGTIRHFRRVGSNPYHLFALAYASMLLLWDYPPNERFLLPVLPVILAGLWTELERIFEALRQRRGAVAIGFACACTAILVCPEIATWGSLLQGDVYYRRLRAATYHPAYRWIQEHTRAEDQFLASEDVVLYLYAGRKGLRPVVPMDYYYRGDAVGVAKFLNSRPALARDHGLDYILDGPRDWRREIRPNGEALEEASRMALARDAGAQRVYEAEGCTIYRVLAQRATAGQAATAPEDIAPMLRSREPGRLGSGGAAGAQRGPQALRMRAPHPAAAALTRTSEPSHNFR